jgi:Peptidase family C25
MRAPRLYVWLVAALSLSTFELRAQACSTAAAGGTLAGIVNTYYPGVGTPAAGAVSINVDTTAIQGNAARIAAGDILVVMQMQDASIDDGNTATYGDGAAGDPGSGATINATGRFEYVYAQAAVGVASGTCTAVAGKVCIIGAGTGNGLINSYATVARNDSGATGRRGQRAFQVIRVPQYSSATLGSTLAAFAWDGRVGGMLAFDVGGTLTLAGATVSVNGVGFRGAVGEQLGGGTATNTDYRTSIFTNTTACTGANNVDGAKGEGIAGTPTSISAGVPGGTGCEGYPRGQRARGGPGNAGGGGNDGNPTANDENSGGGGGANGGAGGVGGNTWNSNLALGGFGGAGFPAALGTGAAVVMGGGGGAGTRNNSDAITNASSGGAGGGIVLIRTITATGTATINANGGVGIVPDNDGGGGGGAGGTVVVVSQTGGLAGLVVNARGGNGSNAWPAQAPNGTPGERHGPGGGGGGGVVFMSQTPTTAPNVSGGTRGTTTTAADAFGAVNGSIGLVATYTLDDLPGVQTCLVNTRASIAGLRALPGAVEFVTASQRGTLGFNVYAQARGKSRRLNDELLRAQTPNTDMPSTYRIGANLGPNERLWIEELEASGRSRWLGPFDGGDTHLADMFEQNEERERSVLRTSGALGAAAVRTAAHSGAQGYGIKIEVTGPGQVRVPLEKLAASGFSLKAASEQKRLGLTNNGRQVPFTLTSDALGFQATEFSSDYTDRNVYILSWGLARQIGGSQVAFTRSGPPLLPGFTRRQEDHVYAAFLDRRADPWVWDLLLPGAGLGAYMFDLEGLAPVTGNVAVRISFAGATSHTHLIDAFLNGVRVGGVRLEGLAAKQLVGSVPGASLRPSGNELRLDYVAAPGLATLPDESAAAYLDAVDVGVTLPVTEGPATVVRVAPFDPSLSVPSDTDYLILSHVDFLAAAQDIARAKTAEGLHPLVVDVERAYDRHAAGFFEAEALRALIRDVARRAPLRYVLLVGDDTFDPRNHTGVAPEAFVPSLNGWDGASGFGRIPSENRYADLDDDGLPDVAIGRLPVQTAEQAATLADKIARQRDVLSANKGQTIAIDNSGSGDLSFRGSAERLAGLLPSKARWIDIGQGIRPARAALLAALTNGSRMIHYFGHGGPEVWADEGLLTTADVPALAGTGRETVLFTWACEAQWYQYLWGPSINEALLLVPRGGTLASVGPVGISPATEQMALAEGVYSQFLSGQSLGESMRRAKRALLAHHPSATGVAEGFGLLGDPALKLPR